MKILDISQSGKRGLTVSNNGGYGRISRALVIPANPRSAPQQGVRTAFGNTAKRCDRLLVLLYLSYFRAVPGASPLPLWPAFLKPSS
jgi:hypothetical protein